MTDRISPVQNEVPEASPASPGRASLPGRLRALILSNKLFTLVLAAGALVRLVAVLGYPGALWFAGDAQTSTMVEKASTGNLKQTWTSRSAAGRWPSWSA